MKTQIEKRSGPSWFTVYEDRFVIVYFGVLALYLLIGFIVFFLPLIDPGNSHRNLPRIGFLILPALSLALVTMAVLGIAVRAPWALKLYPRTAKSFFIILIIASILTFLKEGLIISIIITIPVLLFCLPFLLVLRWGVQHLKRSEVRESFRPQRPLNT